ncbi:MAG: ATP-dependent protease ATPase subunit HslU [Planctomycetota bacterium]
MSENAALTPSQILAQLDQYVVGQQKAKRAVSVALRNRWRRRQLPADMASEVYPKNILLIGPTGVGKTEIARRLASLARAPFVKVEATKYSEVGYHGRDVESMVRDLVEDSVAILRREHAEMLRGKARDAAIDRVLQAILQSRGIPAHGGWHAEEESGLWRPKPSDSSDKSSALAEEAGDQDSIRQDLRAQIEAGELDEEPVLIEVLNRRTPTLNIMGPQGNETMGIDAMALQEVWGRNPGRRTKQRRLPVSEALQIIQEEEAEALMDEDAVYADAIERAENEGIVFIDEVDKVISSGIADGPDVSREGVQRDLLSVVEGCTVYTRYGHVRTDHILFIAAGAFHFHNPSELIPELQGRFPVRVPLQSLTEADFARILSEPKNSLVRQYCALFQTEGVELQFTEDGIARLAALAFQANQRTQDIGARRLFTILEKCLENLSFTAPDRGGEKLAINRELVDEELGEGEDDADLIRYEL